MEKQVVATAKAPGAIGPYSQGIKVGNILLSIQLEGLCMNSLEKIYLSQIYGDRAAFHGRYR